MMPTSRSLLVVDDEKSLVELVSYFLRGKGFDIVQGKDGIDAFSSLLLHEPHLMLLDLCLPCITGLEVIKQLRDDAKTAAVFIVAMSGDSSLLDRALELGADEALAKPFSRERLVEIVGRLMPSAPAYVD
ncbi:response regulator [Pendulispora rubella]|uniref:Response regulator n=1 Tax=Pendulispora rubella TaxID=2741070 RepID=A0ABZ2KVG3_9BACT